MKVLAFAEHYPSPFKGYHDAQFEQFVKDGHELSIFAFERHEGELNPAVARLHLDRNVTYLPATLKSGPRALGTAMTALLREPIQTVRRARVVMETSGGCKRQVLGLLRACNMPSAAPDLCMVHSLRALLNVRFLKAIYPHSIVAFYYHGGEVPNVPVPATQDVVDAFDSVDVVFTNTESAKRHAVSRGCAPDKVVVSPVGFNLEEFPDPHDRSYRRDGVLNLLIAGRLSAEKGVLHGVRAFGALIREGYSGKARLRIVGEGPEQSLVSQYIAANGLEPHVELLGRVSKEKLLDEYRRADVFLLTSVQLGTWEENQACVVQEAMLMRAVVAVGRTGGVPESTAPEMLPYSFVPGNEGDLLRSLRELVRLDERRLAELGTYGRQFAATRYDISCLNSALIASAMASRPKAAAPSALSDQEYA